MKPVITLLATLFVFNTAKSQTVLFSNMETWRTPSVGFPATTLDAVDGWRCPDSLAHAYSFVIGSASRQLFKSTDKNGGSFAARIVTQTQGSLGNQAGVLTNAVIELDIPNQDFTLKGGTPIYGRVNYINAWLKYNQQGGDSANVVISSIIKGGKSNGDDSVVGSGVRYITASQPYTLVSVPIDYGTNTATPNALQIVFTSSGRQATIGSELLIDDVSYSIFPAGISTVNNDNSLDVYPNPANTVLHLASKQPLQFVMYAMNGQQVISTSVNGNANLDLSSLAAGSYFYIATDNDGEVVKRNTILIAK